MPIADYSADITFHPPQKKLSESLNLLDFLCKSYPLFKSKYINLYQHQTQKYINLELKIQLKIINNKSGTDQTIKIYYPSI